MVDEFPQVQVPGEGGRQEQAGIGHQAMVVKEDADTVGFVLWQHLLGAPCFRAGFCSKTIIPDSEEHPLASSRAVPKTVLRWIRVKPKPTSFPRGRGNEVGKHPLHSLSFERDAYPVYGERSGPDAPDVHDLLSDRLR